MEKTEENKNSGFLCGPVVLFGSGETSTGAQDVYVSLLHEIPHNVRIAILETPAGFQPNSAAVAESVADFLTYHLQNYRPRISVIPARRRGTEFSPDNEKITAPVRNSDIIFLGAGSPTYTVRQLDNSLAWQTALACHRQGTAIVLASAAAIAIGTRVLPVYEIYKAGEDLHWKHGLDLFGPFGLSLVFVSHWNNTEGGDKLDTSRCYMGQARFNQLKAMLPPDSTIAGIDEHTALIIDINRETCRVKGAGGVTIIRHAVQKIFSHGQAFSIRELGDFHPVETLIGIPPSVWAQVSSAKETSSMEAQPPAEVLSLVQERECARSSNDWRRADELRVEILKRGWLVRDEREGPRLIQAND